MPILFVHGAFAGAWCWAEYFLPYFSRHGYPAYAVSLRGHGGSDGHERLRWISLRDYVADVEQVITELGMTPILVGYSMGGMVIQKHLEQATAPAVVLMASIPPEGLLCASWWLALRDPLLFHEINLIQWCGPYVATLSSAKRAILSPDMPDWQAAKYFGRMQQESQRVILDMMYLDLPRRNSANKLPPVLVLGAEDDVLVPPALVESTGRAFGTQAEIFPDMAHAMMLEAGWQAVADRILTWLGERGL